MDNDRFAVNVEATNEEARTKAAELKILAPEGRRRVLTGPIGIAASLLAVSFSLFHIYRAYVGTLGPLQQRGIHLAFAIALTFLFLPIRKGENKRTRPSLTFSLSLWGCYH